MKGLTTRPLTAHEKDFYTVTAANYAEQWKKHPTIYWLRNTLNTIKYILKTNSITTYESDNN